MDRYLVHDCPAKLQHEARTTSCEHLSKIGHYFKWLYGSGLWPLSKMQTLSITKVSDRLSKFENYDRDPAEVYWLEGIHYIGCQTPQTDLKDVLEGHAKKAVETQQGLCLACVKRGRVAEEEGNCRAEDEALCVGGTDNAEVA